MKIYLAARYSRRLELSTYRAALVAVGHTVTSRWLNGTHQLDGFETEEDRTRARSRYALEDWEDLQSAESVIAFTEPEREGNSTRGGRHVELGMALAYGHQVIIVGHRENVFCCLPHVLFAPDFSSAFQLLHKHP